MREHKELRYAIIDAVCSRLPGGRQEEKNMEAAEETADTIMEQIYENFRSLSEVKEIVASVRAGEKLRIRYYDPEEEELDQEGMAVSPCW